MRSKKRKEMKKYKLYGIEVKHNLYNSDKSRYQFIQNFKIKDNAKESCLDYLDEDWVEGARVVKSVSKKQPNGRWKRNDKVIKTYKKRPRKKRGKYYEK